MTRVSAQPRRSARRPRTASSVDDQRPFLPGTCGWSVADLDDPKIERLWVSEPLEIIEGVLTRTPPAYLDGSYRLSRLERQIERFMERRGEAVEFVSEADIVIDEVRTVRADSTMIIPRDYERFGRAAAAAGQTEEGRQRIYVPPTLIIESVSPGHELHERQTKFKFYAEFGVPNYWIFEPAKRSLDCFVLRRRKYSLAASGTAPAKVNVPLFDGLKIDLGAIFAT